MAPTPSSVCRDPQTLVLAANVSHHRRLLPHLGCSSTLLHATPAEGSSSLLEPAADVLDKNQHQIDADLPCRRGSLPAIEIPSLPTPSTLLPLWPQPISPPTLPLSSSLTLSPLPSTPVASSHIRQKQRSLASSTTTTHPRHRPLSQPLWPPAAYLRRPFFLIGFLLLHRTHRRQSALSRSYNLFHLRRLAAGAHLTSIDDALCCSFSSLLQAPPHQPLIAKSSRLAFPWDPDALGPQPPARRRRLRQQSSATTTTFDLYIPLLLPPLSAPTAQAVIAAVTAAILLCFIKFYEV
ncbi:hypothetical protein B296_00006126 [Ensete ventricosum]|uniref:Uncharacterized protein n=1 Tax=Ensete ventricosum TaxID=4639 RepID=A0A427ABS7_ENSVE|nr:hypothetical protein B296_00006126 [Ensete ventricosum]